MIDMVTISDIDYKKVVKSPTMSYLHSSSEVSDGSDLDLYVYWGTEVKEILDESQAYPEDFGADPELLADGIPPLMEQYNRNFDAYLEFLETKKRIYKVDSSPDAQIRLMIVYRSASGGPVHYFYKNMDLAADRKFFRELEEAAAKIVNRKYPRSWTKGSKRDIPAFSMPLNSRPVTLRKVPSGVPLIKYQRGRYASETDMKPIQFNQRSAVIDHYLSDRTPRVSNDLQAVFANPYKPGSRVAFYREDTLFAQPGPVENGTKGFIVRVYNRFASSSDDYAWVKWDTGAFGQVRKSHLIPATTSGRVAARKTANYAFSVASMDDVMDTYSFRSASTLIHKAKKDLWSFEKVGDQYVIERLFDDTGEPLVEE